MLDTLYSREGLLRAMNSNAQKFILVKNNRAFQGFASYGLRENSHTVFKLHKLYVLPTSQGKGFGKLLIDEVKKEVLLQGGSMLDLNVNRDNPAKEFYKKLGFRIIREEDNAIGEYWMNDYVMRIDLKG